MYTDTCTETDHHHVFGVENWGVSHDDWIRTAGLDLATARYAADQLAHENDMQTVWIFQCTGGCGWDDDAPNLVEKTEPYWTASDPRPPTTPPPFPNHTVAMAQ
jgi:hypothetical protein